MEGGATDQLDVVVPLSEDSARRFAHHCERLDEEIVGVLAVVHPGSELTRLGA